MATYQPKAHQKQCEPCPLFTGTAHEGATAAAACQCLQGYVNSSWYPHLNGTLIGPCVSCLTGAVCPGVSADAYLFTAAGFWRSSNKTSKLYACSVRSWCPGADCNVTTDRKIECKMEDDGPSACASNRQGILCHRCSPGYSGRICASCRSITGWVRAAVAIAAALGMTGVLFAYFLVTKRPR